MLDMPPLLLAQADKQWARFVESATSSQGGCECANHISESRRRALYRLFACSDFAADSLCQQPELALDIDEVADLANSQRAHGYTSKLAEQLADIRDQADLLRILRRFRRRELLVIAWREMLLGAKVEESFEHISALADALILAAYRWLYQSQCNELGTPTDADGQAVPMLIVGMGKLGGRELNFSSDIDLIFTFPHNGVTQGGRRELANQQFFIRLGQKLVNALHQTTIDGQVYRVDMRLRPFGESGPLAMSFTGMEDYYQHHGRTWERYAMVKARVINGEGEYSDQLRAMLRPFVFRRYIDFGVIDSLRQMKAMIAAEVRRKGLHDNIKLGAGGIREIEFIAQVFQLIRGGREPSLQVRHLPTALAAIEALGDISADDAKQLHQSYRLLRQVENFLQAFDDQQTQTLPHDELNCSRLAWLTGHANWDGFYQQLRSAMSRVRQHFDGLIGDSTEAEEEGAAQVWFDVWQTELDEAELVPLLEEQGLDQDKARRLAQALQGFKDECPRRAMGPQGREALDTLMPVLLEKISLTETPGMLFGRLQNLLLKVATRTAYLQLLVENAGALTQLIRLCEASSLIAEQLAQYPILLDELLVPHVLYNPIPLDGYKDDLRQFLLRVPEEDVEQQMEALRQFKQIHLLRIAAADIAGVMPLMKVSDHLTWLAEAIVEEVINQAWTQISARHGVPTMLADHTHHGFGVIAYGKLGGLELAYSSDLDLVFVHQAGLTGQTNGKKPLDVRQFYLRLAQRIIHLFSTRTPSGVLYELDMRLRPSGDSGLMVSPLDAYQAYLQGQAWTWEHQALVRSRMIVGDQALQDAFAKVRKDTLTCKRDKAALAEDVIKMREKMRSHLLKVRAGEFHLKQSVGGLVDIEFLTQYLVLAYGPDYPALTRWSDNMRILEVAVEVGLLEEDEAQRLKAAYSGLRNRGHRLSLSDQAGRVPDTELLQERQWVTNSWQKWLNIQL
ncbi:bifunctional [glutamate--ammonia ligase]-adenylyl-L-tyrosine phosphorylase/[glutamate--ammonia-ligase] adenylyltransferase [Oceanisphaera pacifica]|uniref:Bifunctional glutamine synthetase adenylyltransferase/adenylyl-removing enzyme n=1 Tax=Oceanisphaera pacifica TaxID=2818389 RepID=A0ABS3NC87_9GAMM|nr:bifunctional [glutamate--ammonia ligase]-adenylyl-L-tyrosine phosphorylase/[glutamate--ammonia-ligase] adenylyltransferase [Oceanisphaera pacifica]MBO1518213.1 bifunctional [glutamate--ammonia ligase]-adenylyl-L-tyrosine phosphorylase/[glutamate--ammonia-ligase] adenylyltransferase [Oceanisphaera pacifica]